MLVFFFFLKVWLLVLGGIIGKVHVTRNLRCYSVFFCCERCNKTSCKCFATYTVLVKFEFSILATKFHRAVLTRSSSCTTPVLSVFMKLVAKSILLSYKIFTVLRGCLIFGELNFCLTFKEFSFWLFFNNGLNRLRKVCAWICSRKPRIRKIRPFLIDCLQLAVSHLKIFKNIKLLTKFYWANTPQQNRHAIKNTFLTCVNEPLQKYLLICDVIFKLKHCEENFL